MVKKQLLDLPEGCTDATPQRIMILGAAGQLGKKLIQAKPLWANLSAYTKSELDITQPDQIQCIVDEVQPDLIINAAAYTQVEQAEQDAALAYQVNGVSVGQLGEIAALRQISLLHISTDYVFNGQQNLHPYLPTDSTDPINVYGASKREGEGRLLSVYPRACIVRTSWLFSEQEGNFVMKILSQLKKGGRISVVQDEYGSPTAAIDLAKAIWRMAEQRLLNEQDWSGIWHYSSHEVMNRYEWAREILQIAQQEQAHLPSVKINPVVSGVSKVKRPAFSALADERLLLVFGVPPSDWRAVCKEICRTVIGAD